MLQQKGDQILSEFHISGFFWFFLVFFIFVKTNLKSNTLIDQHLYFLWSKNFHGYSKIKFIDKQRGQFCKVYNTSRSILLGALS